MFSTLTGYIFGTSANPTDPEGVTSPDEGQSQVEEKETGDDWVVVKDEEMSFLLSTEVVTRNRVNVHEDLSRENFLIENPLSLSSEEIHRGIKIGRKKKRRGKRSSSGDHSTGVKGRRLTPANYQALIPDLANPDDLLKNSRVLTPSYKINNNKFRGQVMSGQDKRREKYNYKRFAGTNNDRKCGQQRS